MAYCRLSISNSSRRVTRRADTHLYGIGHESAPPRDTGGYCILVTGTFSARLTADANASTLYLLMRPHAGLIAAACASVTSDTHNATTHGSPGPRAAGNERLRSPPPGSLRASSVPRLRSRMPRLESGRK